MVEPRRDLGAFLLAFCDRTDAFAAARWITESAGTRFPAPSNVKLFSASHMHHVERVWRDEDSRDWRRAPADRSAGRGMPWTRIAGPAELGVAPTTAGVASGDHG